VIEVVTKLALAHPHVALRLIAEGKQIFATPGNGRLLDTILTLEGKNIQSRLVKFDSELPLGGASKVTWACPSWREEIAGSKFSL